MSNGRDFDDEREQREWDAQESALRAERTGGAQRRRAASRSTASIARALRTPPLDPLPSDFAARTAARALREQRVANETVEVWLERGLVALLLVAGAAALLAYRDRCLSSRSACRPARRSASRPVLSWSFAVAACVGLSSVFAIAGKR